MLPSEGNAYSFDVVLYILEVNAIAFAGLLVLQGLGRMAGLAFAPAGARGARVMPEGLELEFSQENRRIGILIAVMAAGLAVSEAATRTAQTDMLRDTIEASDTWAFFQAKNIRATVLKTDAAHLELQARDLPPGPTRDAIAKAVADMRATMARYESEPSHRRGQARIDGQGACARGAPRPSAKRPARNTNSAAPRCKLGILLASSAVVTGLRWLAYLGGALGAIGVVLALVGWLAPGLFG